jgi:UDP:flavonoid glycosyltransferase YjiC (YdhE family)
MLPVARKLVERGHQVWWHTTADFAAKVTATGAHFVPTQCTPTFAALPVNQPKEHGLTAANGAIRRLFVERMLGQLADYQAILREFPADAVLADMCSLGAVLLHEQGGPPFATLGINPLTLASPDTPPFNSGLSPATTPDPAALGALPANARLERFIPHAELLPHVDVMVTNGGYNGVLTALAHGVPLVAAGCSEDKQEVSARIAWARVGLDLKTDTPSAEQLANAVHRVLHDPIFRRNVRRVQADFAQHDGPTEAAMLLEQLALTKHPII